MNEQLESKPNRLIRFFDNQYFSSVAISILAIVYLLVDGCLLSYVSNYICSETVAYIIFRIFRITVAFIFLYLYYRAFPAFETGLVKRDLLLGIFLSLPAMAVNLLGLLDTTISFSFSRIINGISPAVFEEVVWRGIICSNLLRTSRGSSAKLIVFFVAFLFSLSHVINIFFGLSFGAVIIQCFVTLGMGAIFIAAFIRTGNLWSVIIVHAVNNIIGNLSSSAIISSLSRYYSNIALCCAIGMAIALPMLLYSMILVRASTQADIKHLWNIEGTDRLGTID